MILKSTAFPKEYRYFEWTEGRGDNDNECTSTERKTGQIQIHRQNHTGVGEALYTTTR